MFGIVCTWLVLLLVSGGAAAEDMCEEDKGWPEISSEAVVYLREGCITWGSSIVKFTSVAVPLDKVKLSLISVGGEESSAAPEPEDTLTAKWENYALTHVHETVPHQILMMPVGYPDEVRPSDLEGFSRISGEDRSGPDWVADFKSAFFCLNEAAQNPGVGSRVVIFNAFEDGVPVRMNRRLADRGNCKDVIQVGPRVVEYRSKPGIHGKTGKADYLVFSQGNGPRNFFGYFTYFRDTDLYDIQGIFLTSYKFSEYDRAMRVAVVLTTQKHAALSLKGAPGIEDRVIEGAKTHPIYLGVARVE